MNWLGRGEKSRWERARVMKDVDFHWPQDMETKEQVLYPSIHPSTHSSSSFHPSIQKLFSEHMHYTRMSKNQLFLKGVTGRLPDTVV